MSKINIRFKDYLLLNVIAINQLKVVPKMYMTRISEFQSLKLAKHFTFSAINFKFVYFSISVSFPCMGLHFQ